MIDDEWELRALHCDWIRQSAREKNFSKKFLRRLDDGEVSMDKYDKHNDISYTKKEHYIHLNFETWCKSIKREEKLNELGIWYQNKRLIK